MFIIRIFFLLISIIFISQNLYALEKEMGKIKPEVVIACKEIKNGVERLIQLTSQEDIIEKCRQVAESNFSLIDGVKSYSRIYKSLI